MWHILEGGEVHTRFRWGTLRERECVDELDIDGRTVQQCLLIHR
jgi:hypothetical protein